MLGGKGRCWMLDFGGFVGDQGSLVLGSTRYFVGLDLGQRQDHSALAVVERDEVVLDEMDFARYEQRRARRFRVRFLERLRVGTPYPDVVEGGAGGRAR